MNSLPDDLMINLFQYLPEKDKLHLTTSKKDEYSTDLRKKWIQHNAARRINPIIGRSSTNPLFDENDSVYDITYHFLHDKSDLFYCLHEFANAIMSNNNYTTIHKRYIKPKNNIKVSKFASSVDLTYPSEISNNININIIYRCKSVGRIRNRIRRSLTLKALIG